MLVYYKVFGIIASFALVINIVLLVGLMSILPGATLTMPGIAGIVLTLGMSVDATCLFLSVSKKKFVMVVQSSKPLTKVITVHSPHLRCELNHNFNGNHSLCCGYRPYSRLCSNPCIRCGNFNVYSDYWNTCYRELPIRR